MKKLLFGIFLSIGFFFMFFVPEDTLAQTCSGGGTCQNSYQYACTNSDNEVCNFGELGCSCSNRCINDPFPVYCTGTSSATCGSFIACDDECGPGITVSCSWDPGGGGGGGGGGCSGGSCGAGYQCCAGSGGVNYCSNYCQACNGSNICAPAATNTPVPPTPTPCPGYGTYYTKYCAGNTPHESYANGSCGTTDNALPTCVDSTCYGGDCCTNYGENYSTYCAGNVLHETYSNGQCSSIDNIVTTCANGCSNGACIGAPTPTPNISTPTPTRTPTATPPGPTSPAATSTPTRTPTPTSGPPPSATPTNSPTCADIGDSCDLGCCAGLSCDFNNRCAFTCNSDTSCLSNGTCLKLTPAPQYNYICPPQVCSNNSQCPQPTATNTPTQTPTPTSVPCSVTTSPSSMNLVVGGSSQQMTISVSGLNGATVSSASFGSYNSGIASVNPAFDIVPPFATNVTAVSAGSTAIWATVGLSDGRNCQTTGATDTDLFTFVPTNTPTPVATYQISGQVYVDEDGSGTKNGSETAYTLGRPVLLTSQSGTNTSQTTNSSGNYAWTGLGAGNYNIAVSLPAGYTATTSNPASVTLGPDAVVNFGIRFTQQCADTKDNDLVNPAIDCEQTSCHPDYKISTIDPSLTCDGGRTEDPPSGPCSDNGDNDGDGLVDGQDPECYDPDPLGGPDPVFDPDNPEDEPPSCVPGLVASPLSLSPGSSSSLTIGTCTSVEDPDDGSPPPPYDWDPTIDPITNPTVDPICTTTTITNPQNNGTCGTATWNAPICNSTPGSVVCTPEVTVYGVAGSTTYTRDITVLRSGQINFSIYDVSDGTSCASAGPSNLYTGNVATQVVRSGVTVYSQNITGGTHSFTCLQNGSHTVSIGVPTGFKMVSPTVNNQTVNITNNTQSARFCISNLQPWFQTDSGDVRMRGIVNPIPGGQIGSTDSTFPSIFHSTDTDAVFNGGGSISQKNWVIDNEYGYNDLTKNRNGTVAYSFYKSRARQEGVDITALGSGDFTMQVGNTPTATGIYEVNGDLTIDGYSHTGTSRITLLVNGNVTINSEISVPTGGLLIIASAYDISITEGVGQATGSVSSNASNLEGIYSAEGSIVLEGDSCSGGIADLRLNVQGALIANAKKPFADSGAGSIQNNRSLCQNDSDYPSLFVSTRPDFLTQLTDFYKVSYTKWREISP